MELYSKTDDVLKRPKSAKRLQNAKAILNLIAAGIAVCAGLSLFFGPDALSYAIGGTAVVLFVLTTVVTVLVWREAPSDEGVENNVLGAPDEAGADEGLLVPESSPAKA